MGQWRSAGDIHGRRIHGLLDVSTRKERILEEVTLSAVSYVSWVC